LLAELNYHYNSIYTNKHPNTYCLPGKNATSHSPPSGQAIAEAITFINKNNILPHVPAIQSFF
jgi:hypothetical protein